MIRRSSLDLVIDRIYEAAVIPESWPEALGDMTALAEGAFASLFAFDGTVVRWTGTPEAVVLITAINPSKQPFPILALGR